MNFLRELLGNARRSLLKRRATLGLSVLPNNMPQSSGARSTSLHVAVRVDFFVERREKLDEVEPFDGVVRAQRAPGFLQGGGGGDVPAPGRDGGNQDAHGVCSLPQPDAIEKQKCRTYEYRRNQTHAAMLFMEKASVAVQQATPVRRKWN